MAFVRLLLPVCVAAILAGCAAQGRGTQVGEVGFNPRDEREIAAERAAQHYYDYTAPKAGATIRSNPAGALVEWYNDEGVWVAIGNTPTGDITIEATGKPELFRVSAPGFLPQIRWVAVTPSSEAAVVSFELEPELPSDRYFLAD